MTNGPAAGQIQFRGQTGSLALGAAGVRGADGDLGRPAHGGVRSCVLGLHSSDAAGLTLSPRIATPTSVSRPRPGSPEGAVPRTRRIRPPRHLPGPTGLRAAGALSPNPAFHAATPARRLKSLWPQSELRCSRLPGSSRRARPPPFLGSETASETKNDDNTKEVSPSGTRRGEPRPSRPRPSGVCVLRDTVSTVAPW